MYSSIIIETVLFSQFKNSNHPCKFNIGKLRLNLNIHLVSPYNDERLCHGNISADTVNES